MDPVWKWLAGVSLALIAALAALAYGGALGSEEAEAEEAAAPLPAAEPEPVDLRDPDAAASPVGSAEAAKTLADPEPDRQDEGLTIRSILPVASVMKYGEWHWDTSAAPATGRLIVTVDLKARVVSVFRDGHEIGTAVAMLGTPAHPTPTGQFPILWKQRHNVSEKYNNAPMPWSMFLTRDGIAIHGGSVVENGYASHGCIAVPDPFADRLFAVIRKGDLVVITDGKMIGKGDSLV